MAGNNVDANTGPERSGRRRSRRIQVLNEFTNAPVPTNAPTPDTGTDDNGLGGLPTPRFSPIPAFGLPSSHTQNPSAPLLDTPPAEAPPLATLSSGTAPNIVRVLAHKLYSRVQEFFEKHANSLVEKGEGGLLSKTKAGMLRVIVPEDGDGIPYKTLYTIDPPPVKFIELLQGVEFCFESPGSLERFSEILKPLVFFSRDNHAIAPVQVELNMFTAKSLRTAPDLIAWRQVEVDDNPHAWGKPAYDHYLKWMDAVKNLYSLPILLLVTLRFHHPYRNFSNLETDSKPLREAPNVGIVNVEFEEDT
ncbi:hypothetical protein FBEOM_1188 [Fusarium beomiforme]|uniref:Uncharacterized protein n=1 Tax=Fusarium beomiforme TaxID=44412 RepID=A0A9P5AWB8_9HYPO|nr:hypothetical protein FBEOM_1188 [Fusarium beomiforme]